MRDVIVGLTIGAILWVFIILLNLSHASVLPSVSESVLPSVLPSVWSEKAGGVAVLLGEQTPPTIWPGDSTIWPDDSTIWPND